MVGITFGGLPVTDYANDFWLISTPGGSEPVGYVSSPWFSPELEVNIALAHVPWELREVGTKLEVKLPDEYGMGYPDHTVAAEVVDVPFRPSVNPNAREVAKYKGRDFVD
ncbi:MAG: glycine cleavage T C-terminal barrel domain-containing protein [Woeseiaceae bacterium]|nr:glycine cleavage T C-terminal barrel domain-containing protein [Woeseiaceae bacterium]